MAYRLKPIQYKNQNYHILLQNENGPCPLLAAANSLLLKKSISLPSNSIGAGFVTIEELINVLAEKILNNQTQGSDHHIQEMMTVFPKLQFGLDVNPKFTAGPTGVEYTMELNAFDLLHIDLVHGWLLEPDAQEYEWVGTQTYNQLVNLVIQGNDASAMLEQNPNIENHDELETQATRGSVIHSFLERSAHQLTQYGLTVLHEYVKEGDMVVFFRNNHFNTLTKDKGQLYLLVTDFGYADVESVVWEKLDVIDGDTEYATGEFKVPPPFDHHGSVATTGEHLLANNAQSQADFQLALQLSREASPPTESSEMPLKTASAVDDMERARQASLWEHQQQQQRQRMTPTRISTSPTRAKLPGVQESHGMPQPHPLEQQEALRGNPQLPPATAPVASGIEIPRGPTVAVEAPTDHISQEERDLLLAMQLQRQEEEERQAAIASANDDFASRQLAMTMQQKERDHQQQHVSRPGPPPHRQPTAPTPRGAKSTSNTNCVVS